MEPKYWLLEAILGLQPAEKHFAWLEHEACHHKDPDTHRIIKEIIGMLRLIQRRQAKTQTEEREQTDA